MKPSVWSAGKMCSIHSSRVILTTLVAAADQVVGWEGMQWEEGRGSADSGPDTGPHSPCGLPRFPSTRREGNH